jgi:hypothetical protein
VTAVFCLAAGIATGIYYGRRAAWSVSQQINEGWNPKGGLR